MKNEGEKMKALQDAATAARIQERIAGEVGERPKKPKRNKSKRRRRQNV